MNAMVSVAARILVPAALILEAMTASAAPPLEAWMTRTAGGSGQAPGRLACDHKESIRHAMAVDAAGNTYVTGCSSNGTDDDFLTVKYGPDGSVLWSRRYDGPFHYGDQGWALAVDASGNVVVTGLSIGGQYDYATVKYDSAGELKWVATYNGSGDRDDLVSAVAVDGAGNVIVTGQSRDTDGSVNFATVKYNANGVQQWVAIHDAGEGNANAYIPTDLAVDASGNIVVTGYSEHSSGSEPGGYVTVKYNSAGVRQWATDFNSPVGSIDQASAVAVDGSGNVVVTGKSIGANGGFNFATVKYNSTGMQQWVAYYDRGGGNFDEPHAVAIDSSGGVVVTGTSASGGGGDYYDYATVKYNSAGVQQWVALYNGTDNSADEPYAMVVDGSGNVVVTGYSSHSDNTRDYATVKYNSAGVRQWTALRNAGGTSDKAFAVALDPNGNVLVAGTSTGSNDVSTYATVKYNSAGTPQWVAGMPFETGFQESLACGDEVSGKHAMAVDSSGNAYVAGCTYNGANIDYLVAKFDAAGTRLWTATYNGIGNGDDKAYALALDSRGNVIVTGQSYQGAFYKATTVKFSRAGIQQWAAVFNASDNSASSASALVVDGDDNVVVTGTSGGNYLTVKYDGAGVERWSASYSGSGDGYDQAKDIAVDAAGNVVVTGTSQVGGGTEDVATVKYSSSGIQQWAANYDSFSHDRAYAIVLDGSGNAVVIGSIGGNIATIKYSTAGAQLWSASYVTHGESPAAAAIDSAGAVVVAGNSFAPSGGYYYENFVVAKYSAAGVPQWVSNYDSGVAYRDIATAVALDANGNSFVTGGSGPSGDATTFVTVKYNADGTLQWRHEHAPALAGKNIGMAVAVAPNGDLVVAGTERAGTPASRIAVQRLVEAPDAIFADGFQ